VRLPSGPHRIDVQVDLDVGEPDVELQARDGEDLPVERERIDADAERGPAGPVPQEVFASFQPQDVRVHQPELPGLRFHRRSFGCRMVFARRIAEPYGSWLEGSPLRGGRTPR